MPKFMQIGLIAILLSGCAGSYSTEFKELETTTQSAAAPTPISATPARMSGNVREGSVAAISGEDRPATANYRIGAQDVIEVSVFKVPELSKTVQVSELGTINMPLLGDVPIAGKTGREAEQDLTHLLKAKFLQNPQVTVFVKEYNNQKITVEGAVKRAGVFPLQGRMSLLQAIASAQGLDDLADDTVVVIRNTGARHQAARFDVSDIRDGSAKDPELMAGDVVVAGASNIKKSFNGFMKMVPLTGIFAALL